MDKYTRKKIYPGIWEPKAQVLCYECHGATFSLYGPEPTRVLHSAEFEKMKQPLECSTAKHLATCDVCHRWLDTACPEVNCLVHLRNRLNAAHGRDVAHMGGGSGRHPLLIVPLALLGHRLEVFTFHPAFNMHLVRFEHEADDGRPISAGHLDDEAAFGLICRLMAEDGIPSILIYGKE